MLLYDRILGSLMGVAVGDALGATYEFMPMKKAAKAPCVHILGGGPFDWRPGQPTDDTDQALIVAVAVADSHVDDIPGDVANGLVDWYESCPPDIGATTLRALSRLADGRRELFYPGTRKSESNGSLMRTAPLGYIDLPIGIVERVCRITHSARRCVDLCLEYVEWINHFVHGGQVRPTVWPKENDPRYWYEGGGWVQDSYDIAMWALAESTQSGDPVGALCNVVRLGGDADTNGAIAGGLLGAAYGNVWPKEWLDVLETRDEIHQLVDRITTRKDG